MGALLLYSKGAREAGKLTSDEGDGKGSGAKLKSMLAKTLLALTPEDGDDANTNSGTSVSAKTNKIWSRYPYLLLPAEVLRQHAPRLGAMCLVLSSYRAIAHLGLKR